MKITKQSIKAKWPNAESIEQVGSKQLFKVVLNGRPCLISYLTIVGHLLHEDCETGAGLSRVWHLTPHKYSVTTTQQLNNFAKGRFVKWCTLEEWASVNS